MHPFSCPNCKSRNVRSSLSQNFGEALSKLIGIFQLRCRDCDERWTQPIWDLLNAFYARCPGCYGLELSLWQPSYYRPPPGGSSLWHLERGLGDANSVVRTSSAFFRAKSGLSGAKLSRPQS